MADTEFTIEKFKEHVKNTMVPLDIVSSPIGSVNKDLDNDKAFARGVIEGIIGTTEPRIIRRNDVRNHIYTQAREAIISDIENSGINGQCYKAWKKDSGYQMELYRMLGVSVAQHAVQFRDRMRRPPSEGEGFGMGSGL